MFQKTSPFSLHFYRAKLWSYASARSLLSPGVRPSVSATFVYCIKTAKDIVKLLSWPGSPIAVVFLTLSADTQCRAGHKILGGEKNLRFSTENTVYLGNGTREAHSYYGTLIRSHSDGSISVDSDDRKWPGEAGHDGQTFQADLLNNAHTVWPRTTNFGMITRVGEGVFLGGQVSCYFLNDLWKIDRF